MAASEQPESLSGRLLEGQDWDPLLASEAELTRRPSAASLRRLRSELSGFRTEPLPGILVCPDGQVASLLHALVAGPSGTPYDGGLFHFVLDVPDNYPYAPPRARLLTTGRGTVRFNPQFYTDGKVCLSILHTFPGPSWEPTFTLRLVLLQMQALMNEVPALNEPGPMLMEDPETYNTFLRHETLRVAVLGLAEEAAAVLQGAGSLQLDGGGDEAGAGPCAEPLPTAPGAAPAAQRLQQPLQRPRPRLPAELARAVLEHVAQRGKGLEAACRAAAASTPEGTVLFGVPGPIRARYVSMAAALRRLQDEGGAGAAAGAGAAPGNLALLRDEEREEQEPDGEEAGEKEDQEQEEKAGEERSDEAPPECRICGGGPEDGELVRPCGCGGSIAFVHRSCAAEWVRRVGSPLCPICRRAYSDPGLYALGRVGCLRRSFAGISSRVRLCIVFAACFAFDAIIQSGLEPTVAEGHTLRRWRVEPGGAGADPEGGAMPYRLQGLRLVPARTLPERWRSPLLGDLVLHAETTWRRGTAPVRVRVASLARLTGRRPRTLAALLNRWRENLARSSRKRQGGPLAGPWRSLQWKIRRLAEPLPDVTLRLRPAGAARVAAAVVLCAWLAIGRSRMLWLFMCIHLGCSFEVPQVMVAVAAIFGCLGLHQVQRWLAERGMLRRRPALEGDLLLILLLWAGTCCLPLAAARGSAQPPPAPRGGPLRLAAPWAALLSVASCAMATAAHRPHGRNDARSLGLLALVGLLWAALCLLLCSLAALPILVPSLAVRSPYGDWRL